MLYFFIGVAFALAGFGVLMILGRFIDKRAKKEQAAEDAAKDPYWKQYRHAYGDASDLPALFNLMRASSDFVWSDLWERLCHQGQAFSNGSLAAVPVLVDYASSIEPAARMQPLSLVAAIAADAPHILMPPELREPFASAIVRARTLATESLSTTTSEEQVVMYVTMIAVADGLHAIGSFGATEFFGSELELVCPHCEDDFIVRTDSEPWAVETVDFQHVSSVAPPQDPTVTSRYAAMARERGEESFALWLERLQSLATCPHCGEQTTVFAAMGS